MRSFDSIEPGWEVFGNDRGQIGTVHVAGDDYLEVEKGTFFIKDLFIPRSAVQEADPGERRVTLNVSRDAVGDTGWTEPPVTAAVPRSDGRQTWGQGTIGDDPAADERAPEPELVGGSAGGRAGGVDGMSRTRIEEPADELSAGQVPTERVDEETLEIWSEPASGPEMDAAEADGGRH